MTRFIRIVVGVFVSVIAVNVLLGVSVASATPPFYGQTYAKAAAAIKSYGSAVRVETVIGDQLATDDCIVTNARQASTGNTWILQLNCTYGVAAAGKPGHSITTPEGQAMMKKQSEAKWFNEDTPKKLAAGQEPWCGAHVNYCNNVCNISEMCSDEVLAYLAKL